MMVMMEISSERRMALETEVVQLEVWLHALNFFKTELSFPFFLSFFSSIFFYVLQWMISD